MLHKKLVLTAIVATTTLSTSIAAVAYNDYNNNNNFFNGYDAGFVIGVQGGYADEHWDNLLSPFGQNTSDIKDTGFTARGFIGYDMNQYLGLESGYTYLPKATINGFSTFTIRNYAIDILAKLSVPVTNVFSLYAKAGGSYFNSKLELSGLSQTNTHFGPAFGVGASYEVIPNLAIDVSWMRYSGQGHLSTNATTINYQPSPDMVFLGVSYKFPTHYS